MKRVAAALVLVALAVSAAAASAQDGGRVPDELWSEYPLDPAQGETPPPIVDEGVAPPPTPRRRAEPATPEEDSDELVSSPLVWALLVALLIVAAVAIAARGALPQALEAVMAVPARLRARARLEGVRAAAAQVPGTLVRVAAPAAARVRRPRRTRKRTVATPKRGTPARAETLAHGTVAETLVERARRYVPVPERAPEVEAPPARGRSGERCEIRWWRGFVKSQFYAHVLTKEGREYVAATSPMFRWRHEEAPPPTKAAVAARMALVEQLIAAGWQSESAGSDTTDAPWFAGNFRRRARATARVPS